VERHFGNGADESVGDGSGHCEAEGNNDKCEVSLSEVRMIGDDVDGEGDCNEVPKV